MSELVKFVVYYGPGTVRSNELGVDLSLFQSVELQLTNPENVSISQFQQWLIGSFSLDPQIWTVSVHSLWSSSRERVFRELKPIDRNSQWVHWLNACKRRGTGPVTLVHAVAKAVTQPEDDGGSGSGQGSYESVSESVSHAGGGRYESCQSSQAGGDGYSGEVDGDEEGEHMSNLMAEEDIDGSADDISSDDSDEEVEVDDEGVPIHGLWNQDLSN